MTTAAQAAAPSQRTRILDTALALMGDQGAHVTSMRQLAAACNLNVATLYHYFPSKADLLRAVLEERHYGERLREEPPPIDPALPPRERLGALLSWLGRAALDEEAIWRLILGESLRGEEVALDTVLTLAELMEGAYVGWFEDAFPEFEGDREAVAAVLRGQIFALCVEALPLKGKDRGRHVDLRARQLAALVFP